MDDIDRYLREDLGEDGDITSNALFSNEEGIANIVAKDDCIVAGLEEVKFVFQKVGAFTKLECVDGASIKKNTIVIQVKGPIKSILKGERLALNIIGRMSGIATETRKLVELCRENNSNIQIAATRKTTPGFRKFEKKAVKIGGGEPHRFGLFDAVMIKDNHLKNLQSVEIAIKKIKEKVQNKTIEIEVENEEDAIVSAKMNVDVIMLDNFDSEIAEKVVKKIKKINPNILIEISGNINRNNIEKYSKFADRISLGCLTHSIKNIDFSLEMLKI
jgi:nicotinate-nucleotide pyrophosphorylase (carboxylating)